MKAMQEKTLRTYSIPESSCWWSVAHYFTHPGNLVLMTRYLKTPHISIKEFLSL